MSLQLFLLLAAGLFAVGLYGALSQQSIVMIMMGLELMLNGVIVAAAAFWHYVAPAAADGQVIVVVAVVAMAVEMAAGFAAATAIFRARDVDMADDGRGPEAVSSLPWLAWLLPAVPLAAGAGLAVAGRRVNAAAPWAGAAAGAVTLVLACAAAAARPSASAPLFAGIPAGVRVDGMSAVLVITVAAVTLAVLVFAVGEFGPEENRGRFFGLMLIFAGAMLVTVTATTLALLLMGWEMMGATSYALIGYWWREPRRVTAANVAFLTTRAADLGLYVAAGAALAGGVSGLALAGLPRASSPWLDVVTAGVVLAAFGKSAQLPLSFWLSRAMEGPSPVSALLHSATMVAAGAYLLLRTQALLAASGWGEPAVAWTGAATALVLGLVAVAQDRPEAAAGRLDVRAGRVHGARRGRGRGRRRGDAARRACRHQEPAVPGRRGVADRAGHQTAGRAARRGAAVPGGGRGVHGRRADPGGAAAVVAVGDQGRGARRRAAPGRGPVRDGPGRRGDLRRLQHQGAVVRVAAGARRCRIRLRHRTRRHPPRRRR